MTNLINSDCLHMPLASKSVHMIATSPPYWGLRSYATGDKKHLELGAETLHDCGGWVTGNNCGACYICHLRQFAAECWRVLRDDGTFWLNLGDSYAGGAGGRGDTQHRADGASGGMSSKHTGGRIYRELNGLKPKDLTGIPWRAALALQADGWYLRSDIIWAKPNPMPESVTDRPTKAHEYVFLLTKQERYYYDAEAVKEAATDPEYTTVGKIRPSKDMLFADSKKGDNRGGLHHQPGGRITRNARTVWNIATHSYSGAHFATWPPKLVERMIKAGTSERGCCAKCGAQMVRVVEREKPPAEVYAKNGKPEDIAAISHPDLGKVAMGQKLQNWYNEHPQKTTGWAMACTCNAETKPSLILDPFAGSGTTLMVARKLGREAIGLDLSMTYLQECAMSRLELDALNEWAQGEAAQTQTVVNDLPLFGGVE